MLLMPNKEWQWVYNDSYNVLSISLGDEMEFLTPYTPKVLIPDALASLTFSVEHAKFYIQVLDRLSRALSCDDAYIVQMALNATAAHFLLKPEMPKSWYFSVSDFCVFSETGKLFHLQTRNDQVTVLVIESGFQASLVMLLSESCLLSDKKTLKQFETIKVMHDRLIPLLIREQVQVVAA
ncbi:cell division protein ZapC [Shewanella surugensis]|uniref:Cell division protein ZapC n=1 Tax=Shewanella surugensis TaxID=212020 RepID=A0ABT0LB21_9GAMM|nr:cell division protein ZapC [Shewanella surugensis]MCL1124867.1 cell division protein ZapC [Shewanella surugensis]